MYISKQVLRYRSFEMECPRRWTIVAFIIYLSAQDAYVFGQNVAPGGGPGSVTIRDNRDCSRPHGNSMSTDMLNSILNVAATNGVLPDLVPMLQGQPMVDNLQRFSYPQEAMTMPLSVVPMPTPGSLSSQESILLSGQPIRPPVNQNVLYATPVPGPLPCGAGCPNTLSATTQTILPQIAQAFPLENYPMCAQNIGVVRPMPVTLQPQCQFNEINPFSVYNQMVEPLSLQELSTPPLNVPLALPPPMLPTINTCPGTVDVTPNLGLPCLPQPTVFTSDGQQLPLNLQINVPQPSAPGPRITVVSASPPNAPIAPPTPYFPDYSNIPSFQYPPQPPIVVGGSKSSLRNLLPIILVALFSDRGYNNNGGGCCCCCCSGNNGNSKNNIPIPYPIPIPVNNPIVNCPCSCSSRYRDYRDDGDDDDDRKRK